MIASGTPCESSVTVSRSGHLVALIRLRISVISASEKPTWNGLTAPFDCSVVADIWSPRFGYHDEVCQPRSVASGRVTPRSQLDAETDLSRPPPRLPRGGGGGGASCPL